MAYQLTDNLKTGNTLIDQEHQQLFDAINALLDACAQGNGRTQIAKTGQFLVSYTTKHFGDEEKLQQQSKFPNYPNHKRYHETFKAQVADLVGRLNSQGPSVALVAEVNTVLANWLIQHIKQEDKKLAEHIRSMGA